MQHDVAVSPELLQLSCMFDISDLGRRRKKSRPGPLGSLCFRLLHLRDAIRHDELKDRATIYETAVEIDRDLMAWAEHLPAHTTVDASADSLHEAFFQGKRHIYSNLLVAQAWNNWRTLRIVVNRIVLENEVQSEAAGTTHKSPVISVIRQLSTDICTSAASFAGSPRKWCPSMFFVCRVGRS